MNNHELLAAAEYGRRLDLLGHTVSSADKTRAEYNSSLRFPTPYLNVVQHNADTMGLDIARAYGLIRQELRFIVDTRSSVGTPGPMQVTPETAKHIAKKTGLLGPYVSQMSSIGISVPLGTAYLSMILANLDSSVTLAATGCNAGPGRPKRWHSMLTRSMRDAIFVGTVPFNEIRTYVKNVLPNATYYSALLTGRPQSLKDRLDKVVSESVTPDNLL